MKKILSLILVLFLSACSQTKQNDQPKVVTTFLPYNSLTQFLAGDVISVENIMPLNMEVHDYEPSPKDIALLEEADLLIAHGAGLEDWLDKTLESVKNKNLKVVYMADAVTLLPQDPHTWLSAKNAQKQFTVIKDALIDLYPKSKDDINENYQKGMTNFNLLIEGYAVLNQFSGKEVIVDHLAYNYLLSEFDIKQSSYMSEFNAEEPTAKEIEATIQFIKDNTIHTIFETEHEETKILDIIVKETGVKVLKLNTLERATEVDGNTYFEIMWQNLERLEEGLK